MLIIISMFTLVLVYQEGEYHITNFGKRSCKVHLSMIRELPKYNSPPPPPPILWNLDNFPSVHFIQPPPAIRHKRVWVFPGVGMHIPPTHLETRSEASFQICWNSCRENRKWVIEDWFMYELLLRKLHGDNLCG